MPYNFLEPLNFTYFARSGLLPSQFVSLQSECEVVQLVLYNKSYKKT